jgi:hypothetical protein
MLQIDKLQDEIKILASFDMVISPRRSQVVLMTKGLVAVPLDTLAIHGSSVDDGDLPCGGRWLDSSSLPIYIGALE